MDEKAWPALVAEVRERLRTVAAAGATITYDELGLAHLPADGERSLPALLRAVSQMEEAVGRGLVTAVVVRRSSGLPGGGFFRLAAELGRDTSDRRACWEAELARVHAVNRGLP